MSRQPRPEHKADERPLPEKLAEQVEPVVYTIDITNGRAYKILGSGHDITRLLTACKSVMNKIEDEGLDPDKTHFVTIPAREVRR
jgi:hypothetical protein